MINKNFIKISLSFGAMFGLLLTSSTSIAKSEGGLKLSMTSHNFKTVKIGESKETIITMKNTGSSEVTNINYSASLAYSVESECGSSLAAGDQCQVVIRFSPAIAGKAEDSVFITTPDQKLVLKTSGSGIQNPFHKVPQHFDGAYFIFNLTFFLRLFSKLYSHF
ncbi:MAG: choice-of-anchor D domain-containing protein [Bdellovibrionales bacterium]